MRKANLCVIVPAFNEEQVINRSLAALAHVIEKKHIYVVSDGSTDSTARIARGIVPNVLALRKNLGKAQALNKLIQKYELTKRYHYILFSDADSRLDPEFKRAINKALPTRPACLVGTVKSDRRGLISAFRVYEYGLSHRIYKQAQNILNVITVAPGCASVYRSDVLEQLDFSRHTLTEDFDLTLQIHKRKLGRVLYVPRAKVITQDPPTLPDYWKQIMRWNTGTWQNFMLHQVYKPTDKVNWELYIMLADALVVVATTAFAIAHPRLLGILFLSSYLGTIVFATIILALERAWWAFRYILLFPIFYAINFAAFFISLFRAITRRNQILSWNKVSRYV